MMSFLGLHLGLHDCNISAYKDGQTYYNKYERCSGIKHGFGNFKWIDDTLKKWDIDWSDIEEICMHTSDSLLNEFTQSQQSSMLPEVLRKNIQALNTLKAKNIKITEIDHHILHTYSTLNKNKQVVLDGKGTGIDTVLLTIKS